MPTLIQVEESLLGKAERLEFEIEELLRQRSALQLIERWNSEYDYADFLETVALLEAEIDEKQEELRKMEGELASASPSFSSSLGDGKE